MPIYKCSNGKYRIGTGSCIYNTEEKAIEVWQAILASGEYAAVKVSYDYDETLTTARGMAKAKRDIAAGKEVYIISARNDKAPMLEKAKELGIPANRVYATGSNREKVATIRRLKINEHIDNNNEVIKQVRSAGIKGTNFAFQDSYNDYPQAATNNAKKALNWADKNGWGSCGTPVGKARANQLANREPISRETIARMASFKRHQQNKSVPYEKGCGGLMWDAWGGDEGIEWAIRKLKQIDEETH